MSELIKLANKKRLKVLFIGGFNKIADILAEKLSKKYLDAEFLGIEGYKDISTATTDEEVSVKAVIEEYKPDMVFVAFGAPTQEQWMHQYRTDLKHSIAMSVGGSFDMLSGRVPRAPVLLRSLGLEWLFRLILQPWRWRRQLKLLSFIGLVFKQKLGLLKN